MGVSYVSIQMKNYINILHLDVLIDNSLHTTVHSNCKFVNYCVCQVLPYNTVPRKQTNHVIWALMRCGEIYMCADMHHLPLPFLRQQASFAGDLLQESNYMKSYHLVFIIFYIKQCAHIIKV